MNVRNFLAVAAVVAFVFGLSFILIPGPLMSLYGVSLDAVGTVVGQLFGAALLGFGTLNWFARRLHSHDAEAIRPVLMANLVSDGVGFFLSLFAQISGTAGVNGLGWSTVLIYLLLALGAAYFLFMPQGRSMASAR